MKAILLIGGLGTRLRPLTLKTPKPLLPILDQPFLAYQLDFLSRHGFHDIILCTAYRAQDFHDTLGDGKHLGVHLTYVHEDSPLGTGGAIKNAEPYIGGSTLICNGDILMNLDVNELVAFHQNKKAAATIGLTHVEDTRAFGVVETTEDGRVGRFLEKPAPGQSESHAINAGIYIFEKSVFPLIPAGVPCSVERDTFPGMLKEGLPLYGKELKGYWLDVGTLEKYEQAQRDVTAGRYPHRPVKKVLQ